MNTYVIGDIHGCFDGLLALMDKASVAPTDQIVFLGDLIDKGTQNVEVLRWLSNQNQCKVVLGNHDIYILNQLVNQKNALSCVAQAIANQPDSSRLIEWLLDQGLILKQANTLFCHAGIHPLWEDDLIEEIINDPKQWINPTTLATYFKAKWTKLALTDPLSILAACTEMRFLKRADYTFTNGSEDNTDITQDKVAWFELAHRHGYQSIFFGHWARLNTIFNPGATCLDGGFVYGNDFLCYNLDQQVLTTLHSQEKRL